MSGRTITEYVRRHLHEICGLYDKQPLDEVVKEQCRWSKRFMTLMISRIVFGRYRYGYKDCAVRKDYKYMDSAMRRLVKYASDGNTEHLVDIANLCMLEFEFGEHPNKHFKSIDDGEHVKEER